MLPVQSANTCVVGLQWGDEGKGKIVDFLAEQADVVVRYCGGANAGHTVRIGSEKYSTHLLPVGVFRPGKMNLIGNGVVLDPAALFKEIDDFAARGIAVTPANLRISYKTHLVMPYHMQEDAAREAPALPAASAPPAAASARPTPTKCTAPPPFASPISCTRKISSTGSTASSPSETRCCKSSTTAPPGLAADLRNYRDFGRRMQPFVDDTTSCFWNYAREGKRIVFEGAHAVLLDVDHGTYPYVTSSNCSALGVYTGAGVPPQMVQNFVGVMKAYTTRVGGGPFPTEQDNQIGNYIRERGNEYGTTTRRPRRCGWFDAMAVDTPSISAASTPSP